MAAWQFLDPPDPPRQFVVRPVAFPSDKAARRRWEASREPVPAPPKWRVLVPVPPVRVVDADPDQVPAPAARIAAKASAAGAVVRTTYSLCEGDSGLLTVIAVRVQRDGQRGWATWHNGKANAAQWWGGEGWPRNVGHRKFAALAVGDDFEPPSPRPTAPQGPCPRCGRMVRWRIVGGLPVTWAHFRPAPGEAAARLSKEKCE